MARGHLFFIVVLLSAAAVAGLLAVAQAAEPAPASASAVDPAITFRMKRLDRLEASLEQQLARPAVAQTAPAVVYQRAQAPVTSAHQGDEDPEGRESEHEGERDD